MATQTEINPKIYDADSDPLFKGKKIYLDPPDENNPYHKRRYFETRDATVYSEPFVKNDRGQWVGQVSAMPGQGQRLIRTGKGRWVLCEYSLETMNETKAEGVQEHYPREFLSDSQAEYHQVMDKGFWGLAVVEESYRLIEGSEAERWLLTAGFDLDSQDFRGVKFEDLRNPAIYAGPETMKKEPRPGRFIEV